jgi:hypothetical protein
MEIHASGNLTYTVEYEYTHIQWRMINFLAKIQVPVSAEMVPGKRLKSAEVTEPGRAAQAFFKFK